MSYAEKVETLLKAAHKGVDNERTGDTSIHVSDLINFCPKEYFLCYKHDRTYHPQKYFDLRSKWDFSLGHAVQDIQVASVMKAGTVFASWRCNHCGRIETGLQAKKGYRCPKCKCRAWTPIDLRVRLIIPTKKKFNIVITGGIDFVVALKKNFGFIVDAKSIGLKRYEELTSPAIDYRRQVILYLWLGSHPDTELVGHLRKGAESFRFDNQVAVLSYAVKGSKPQPFKSFDVERDPKFIGSIEDKLDALVKAINTGKAPPSICQNLANNMAKKCAVRDLCFNQGKLL